MNRETVVKNIAEAAGLEPVVAEAIVTRVERRAQSLYGAPKDPLSYILEFTESKRRDRMYNLALTVFVGKHQLSETIFPWEGNAR